MSGAADCSHVGAVGVITQHHTILGKAVDEYRARELVELVAAGLGAGIKIDRG